MSKSHGIKGEIFIRPFNSQANWPQTLLSIKIGERFFSIERCSIHKQGFIVKLKNCRTKEEADQFQSQPVFLAKEYFTSKKGDDIYLAELLGFEVEVSGYGAIGKVLEFQSDKYQDFLALSSGLDKDKPVVSDKCRACLVPFVLDYIQKLDFEKKRLLLNLPENFLSLFYTDPV